MMIQFRKKQSKYFWLPAWAEIKSEAEVHPHSPTERPELFEAYNTGTTELELLNWLHATVRLIKPQHVVETGSHSGIGTLALAHACRLNGFGTVHSLEIDSVACDRAEQLLKAEGVSEQVRVHRQDSREFLATTDLTFDLGFFDSLCEIRVSEFEICLNRHILRQIAVFHDTSPLRCDTMDNWPSRELHDRYRDDLKRVISGAGIRGSFESKLSRGFVAIFLS
jgi:predicted O-methyltransferase YrrM